MKAKNEGPSFETERSAWVNERYIANNEFDLRVEEITRNGYTVIEDLLGVEDVSNISNKIDEVYDEQIADFGGEEALFEIGEHGLARNLLQYDEYFLDIITKPEVLNLIKHFLGDYCTLFQFNGNLNISDLPATSTPWHRDITFRDFTSSRPISMTTIWVIDEFNEENDGISILPGSQKHELFPSFEFAEKFQQKLYAKAGSAIVLDGMFFHRSGFNNSGSRRRTCQGMYALPFMAQQIAVPKTLEDKYRDDPFLKHFLGYNSMQQSSVYDWRKEKLDNKRKKLDTHMFENDGVETVDN